jgi:hypothetical protein
MGKGVAGDYIADGARHDIYNIARRREGATFLSTGEWFKRFGMGGFRANFTMDGVLEYFSLLAYMENIYIYTVYIYIW